MKKTMIAAAAALAISSSAALAGSAGLGFVGTAEYAVEAEEFEATAGVAVELDALTITPSLVGVYSPGDDIAFGGVEVDVNLSVSESVSLYGEVEFTDDFAYEEATVGVAVNF